MKRTLVAATVTALALTVAHSAVAKEIEQAQVCGTDGCTTVGSGDHAALVNGGPPRTPPTAARFYKVRIDIGTGAGHTERLDVAAVPERKALRGDDGTWMEMPPALAAAVAKAARGHHAFPAADLAGAAPAPRAPSAPADSPLWPEGVLIAIALAGVGVALVRAVRPSGRFGPASS